MPGSREDRKTGIDPIGDAPWGTHFCHFYETKADLVDLLVPYFRTGLENNEFCMWITSEPLKVADAERALRKDLPELDDYIGKQQIEILDYSEWYMKGGEFDAERVLQGWVEKERSAIERGFDGLRLTGNTFWLEKRDWRSFTDYEAAINSVIGQHRMIALCSYALNKCGPHEFMDVIRNHQFALVKREGEWELIASSALQLTRQALLEERTRYQTLFEQAPDGIVIIDPETRGFLEFNGAAHRQLGYSREEFARLRLLDIEAAEEPAQTGAHVQEVLRLGRDDFETRHRAKDGEIRDVLVTVQTVMLSGRPVFHGIFRDITERKRAEEALAEQRLLVEAVLDQAADAIMVCGAEGTLLFVNAAARRMTGLSPGELIHTARWGALYNSDGQPVARGDRALARALRGEVTIGLERRLVRPDGSSSDALVSAAPVRNAEGEIVAAVSTVTDITDRKQAEEALREHREDLNRAQAVAHTGSWRLDVRRDELLWSDETHRMFGIPKGTPMTYETFLQAVHPEDREYVDQEWTAAMRGEPYDIEHRIVVGDTVRWVREQAELEFDKGGTLLGGFGTVQDITERKRAEEELEKLRSEFVGIVTHELKTPLTAIKGSAATALGSRKPLGAEESRELFQIIDEQADRLRDLVNDLLDMTRIEAGTLSVSPEPVDLGAILEEARATFVRSGGRQPVELELPDDLPTVNADRHRVVQVLTNLLSNAAKSSPATAPIAMAAEHDPIQVTVHVRDLGRGIPGEKLPLLFKKFAQIHEDTGRWLAGTGLGLAICKGIVEAHGGRIWAESGGEGQGSTFSFTLPVAIETSIRRLTDEARQAMHLSRVRRAGGRTRVLAVDDEPQILRYLQRSLEEAGYQAIVTSDPSQVTKLVELEEPDLVLLDLRLPGTSGFELLQRIREFSGVPVIFLTASGRDEDTVRALKMGADDYITKPFSPSELLARIGAALRRRLLPDLLEVRPPFRLGDLTINFTERLVSVGGREVSLSPTEYKILYELTTHAGRVLTHDQLLHQVWGPEYSGETELVRSFVRNLRRKLGDDARHPRYIFTEPGVGYRMPSPKA